MGPVEEPSVILEWSPEQLADDEERERLGEVGQELKGVRICFIQELVSDLGYAWLEARDASWGEFSGEKRPDAGVVGWF